jgi:tol-pal system protein YbgF
MRLLRSLFSTAFFALMVFAAPVQAQDATELLLRIDRLESENRRLNGEVEQMQFQVQRLEDVLKKMQADVDFRFQDLEGGAAARPKGKTDETVTAPEKPKQKAAVDTPQIVTDEPVTDEPVTDEPKPKTEGPAPPVSGDSLADGNAALEAERYADAEVAFRAFLKANSKGKGASDAMFGLGESLYLRERYADAAEHYLNITNQFPKATRAPEALLRLGMSLKALGATTEACSTFAEVSKKYPAAPGPVKEAVKRQRNAAKCS